MGTTSNGKQLTCMKITKLTMVGRLGAVINSLRIIGIVNEKYQKAVRFFEKKNFRIRDSSASYFLRLKSRICNQFVFNMGTF